MDAYGARARLDWKADRTKANMLAARDRFIAWVVRRLAAAVAG